MLSKNGSSNTTIHMEASYWQPITSMILGSPGLPPICIVSYIFRVVPSNDVPNGDDSLLTGAERRGCRIFAPCACLCDIYFGEYSSNILMEFWVIIIHGNIHRPWQCHGRFLLGFGLEPQAFRNWADWVMLASPGCFCNPKNPAAAFLRAKHAYKVVPPEL